jgi:methylglutaconyl-CoA hydratase
MAYSTIRLERDARGVLMLTLARPQKRNAMSGEMLDELAAAAAEIAADKAARVLVLTGSDDNFCAGGDLDWMRGQFEADRVERERQAMKLALMLRAMNELPVPVIGRINGHAFGGGLGLMSICDVAIVAQESKFAFTETRLGLIPATIGPYVIARMGEANARRVFMSGRTFGAAEAVALGLAARVAPLGELDSAIAAETEPYLSCSPSAVASAKALIRHIAGPVDESLMRHTASRLADCWEGDAREGVSAFFEKRAPHWKAG